jgi:exonuclease VII small subunit
MSTLRILTQNMISGEVPLEKLLKHYEEPIRDHVILMLMRCKKLFNARAEVKQIIMLLIQMND